MVNPAQPFQSGLEVVLPTQMGVDEFADAVARRLLNLLRDADNPVDVRPLDAKQVGERLGRSRDWVYAHREELGVLPATGQRPRLMFDPRKVAEYATARQSSVRSVGRDDAAALTSARARRQRMSSGTDLLPIRGQSEGDQRAA